MVKASSKYYFKNPPMEESIVIEVNHELLNSDHIKIDWTECWRSRKETIKYLNWLKRCVAELPKE